MIAVSVRNKRSSLLVPGIQPQVQPWQIDTSFVLYFDHGSKDEPRSVTNSQATDFLPKGSERRRKLPIDIALRARFDGTNEEVARRGILFSTISEKSGLRRESFADAGSECPATGS